MTVILDHLVQAEGERGAECLATEGASYSGSDTGDMVGSVRYQAVDIGEWFATNLDR